MQRYFYLSKNPFALMPFGVRKYPYRSKFHFSWKGQLKILVAFIEMHQINLGLSCRNSDRINKAFHPKCKKNPHGTFPDSLKCMQQFMHYLKETTTQKKIKSFAHVLLCRSNKTLRERILLILIWFDSQNWQEFLLSEISFFKKWSTLLSEILSPLKSVLVMNICLAIEEMDFNASSVSCNFFLTTALKSVILFYKWAAAWLEMILYSIKPE